MTEKFEAKQSKLELVWLLPIAVVFAVVGWQAVKNDQGSEALIGFFVLVFGLLGVVVILWKLILRGSGLCFYNDKLEVELANGKKYAYSYADIKTIGIQELQMPGFVGAVSSITEPLTAVASPLSLAVSPQLFTNKYLYLGIKFQPNINVPKTTWRDEHLYSQDKLNLWQDNNKLDLYFALSINLHPNKIEKLLEFLQNKIKLDLVVLPPLSLK